MKPWKVLSSSISFEDKWLKVRSDRCETADGRIIDPFHIIERRDWICIIALTDTGDMVAIREYRHGAEAITIGLPGGDCDPDDTDPAHTAARELEEETGYRCRQYVDIGSAHANFTNQNNQIHFFMGFGASPSGAANFDPNEEIETVLMPYEDFARFDFEGPKQSHHAAALFYAERYFAHHPGARPASKTRLPQD